MIEIFLYVLLVIFIVLFTIVSCKWQDEVHRNIDLQDDNSDLIERNQKLDTYLDEARAEAVKANHELMKLEYTEKVFIVRNKHDKRIIGVFREYSNSVDFVEGKETTIIPFLIQD